MDPGISRKAFPPPIVALTLATFFLCASCGLRTDVPGGMPPPSLSRRWLVRITMEDLGSIYTTLRFSERGDGTIEAQSRPGAMSDLSSSVIFPVAEALLWRCENGAMLHLWDGRFLNTNNGISLYGELASPGLGRYLVQVRIREGAFAGRMAARRTGAVVGFLDGWRSTTSLPLRDYRELAADVLAVIEERIYDPDLAATPDYEDFEDRVLADVSAAKDDMEAVYAFARAAHHLGISHLGLSRIPERELPAEALPTAALPRLMLLEDGIAYARFGAFPAAAEPVDSLFAAVCAANVRSLLIDLRGNQGGDLSSMAVAAHLVADTLGVGIFAAKSWWLEHDRPPGAGSFYDAPGIGCYSVDSLTTVLEEEGTAVEMVYPREPLFGGEVIVLTDCRTSSACEPLVYFLQSIHRATVVGDITAGAVLCGTDLDLGEGWVLRVPVADYYALDGTRLEGTGVIPDVRCKADKAHETAMRILRTNRTPAVSAPYDEVTPP
ncbi:hypothetical protein GF402_06490 [Candidatus Fermentibacteria bacterium]|nr:hypothetical protein [Candidatus Fermentibacteria bacterium]